MNIKMDSESLALDKMPLQLPPITGGTIVRWMSEGAMIFGGVVPYIPQYFQIHKSHNAEGFSTYVCLTLLTANLVRILFWFGKHYETPLLIQSIIMCITMMALMELCVRVKNKTDILLTKPRTFNDFDRKYFWKWTDFISYVEFVMTFLVIGTGITYLFLDFPIYVESIGSVALLTEAMLGAPQFYKNVQNKSTKGMNLKMVLAWLCGDLYKTGYFVIREAPLQFWVCGILQCSIDVAILIQVYIYWGKAPKSKDHNHL